MGTMQFCRFRRMITRGEFSSSVLAYVGCTPFLSGPFVVFANPLSDRGVAPPWRSRKSVAAIGLRPERSLPRAFLRLPAPLFHPGDLIPLGVAGRPVTDVE